MKKKFISIGLLSALLSACVSPKYKVSDQKLLEWIGQSNDIEQCIFPSLTNSSSYSFLTSEQAQLLTHYGYELRAQIIGGSNERLLKTDPMSSEYFSKRHAELNHYNKANVLTSQQCEAYKSKFANDLATLVHNNEVQRKIIEQNNIRKAQIEEQNRIKWAERRARYDEAVFEGLLNDARTPRRTNQVIIHHQHY